MPGAILSQWDTPGEHRDPAGLTRLGYLTRATARGIDPGQQWTAGRGAFLRLLCGPVPDQMMPPYFPPPREFMQVAETMLIALPAASASTCSAFRAPGLGLDAGGSDRRARWPTHESTVSSGAPMFCAGRYLVGGGGHAGDVTRHRDLAGEHCVARRLGRFACSSPPTCYLRLVHHWDPLSALLGASPGSMAQVLALSADSALIWAALQSCK